MDKKRMFGEISLTDTTKHKTIRGVWLNIKLNSIILEVPDDGLRDSFWELITGQFNGLDQVTFINCFEGGGSSGSGGGWMNIIVSFLIKDCHFKDISDLRFNKIQLTSPALSNWIKDSQIVQINQYNFKIPENQIIFSIALNEFSISLMVLHTGKTELNSFTVNRKCVINIEANNIHFNDLLKLIHKIKKLILFLTNKNPEFSEYTIHMGGNEFELLREYNNLNETRFAQNIYLTYFQIKPFIAEIFKTWLTDKLIVEVVDLIQEKNYNTDLSFQGYFLNTCIALESFHDKFKILDKNVLEEKIKIRKEIAELIVDASLKKYFLANSKSWERLTLRDRLFAYKDPIQKIMGDTFGFSLDILIVKALKTRNNIAHTGKHDEFLTYFELFIIGKLLEFTLKIEVLNKLGYTSANTEQLLEVAKNHIKTIAKINRYNQR